MTHATIPPMFHHRRDAGSGRPLPRPATVLATLVLIVAACGTPGPTAPPASPSTPASSTAPTGSAGPVASATPVGDASAIYRTIEDQVIDLRGLKPKAAVNPTLIDDAGIKKLINDSFRKDNPADLMAANERILKTLDWHPQYQEIDRIVGDALAWERALKEKRGL